MDFCQICPALGIDLTGEEQMNKRIDTGGMTDTPYTAKL